MNEYKINLDELFTNISDIGQNLNPSFRLD